MSKIYKQKDLNGIEWLLPESPYVDKHGERWVNMGLTEIEEIRSFIKRKYVIAFEPSIKARNCLEFNVRSLKNIKVDSRGIWSYPTFLMATPSGMGWDLAS